MEASGILERIAACLPCAACGSRSWQLWPGEFDDDAQPILTAPTPALAECLIPPSVSHIYADRQRSPSGVDAPWDTGVRTIICYCHACITNNPASYTTLLPKILHFHASDLQACTLQHGLREGCMRMHAGCEPQWAAEGPVTERGRARQARRPERGE